MQELNDSRLKIERANHHIEDIQRCITSLEKSDVSTIETNPYMGNEVIKHDVTDVAAARKIALRIGDAVHNLKCALDYAWFEIISVHVPTAVSGFAKFPIYPSGNELEGVLKGRKIDVASPALFRLVVNEIRPYEGGNDAIWAVHRLDILDKHRLLIPLVHYGSVGGIETIDGSGQSETRGTWGTWQKFPWYIHVNPGFRVKNKGNISVKVLFDEATPVSHLDVINTLTYCSKVVTKLVELFEKL